MRLFLTSLLSLIVLPLTLTFAIPVPDPSALPNISLDPRQELAAPGNYTAGGFSVAASSSPFLTANGVTYFLQTDGNFVAYTTAASGTRTAVFNSGTAGHNCVAGSTASCQLAFQSDGNLVLYVGSTAVWATNTNAATGTPGKTLALYGSYLPGSVIQYVEVYDAAGNTRYSSGIRYCVYLGCRPY
ncbi:hypothetical protein MMC10_010046 [Thelotrema lepadinum]|nr:hypothetical protein [Thelotrema lepadinum]